MSSEFQASTLCALTLIAVLSTICCPAAHAYLDSGTGAFLIQMFLGGLMGLMVVLTRFRTSVAAFFARMLGKAPKETGPEDTATKVNE